MGEWLQGSADDVASIGIENPADPEHAAFTGAENERASLDHVGLIGRVTGWVVSVALVMAEVAESPDRAARGFGDQSRFVESPVAARALERRRLAGDQREMGEADLAACHRLHAGRQL